MRIDLKVLIKRIQISKTKNVTIFPMEQGLRKFVSFSIETLPEMLVL